MADIALLEIDQGCTYRAEIAIAGDDGDGTPQTTIDLTGASARMQIRSSADSPAPWVTLTSDASGGLTLNGTAGTIDLELTDAQTAAFPVPRVPSGQLATTYGVFDIRIILASGDVVRGLSGFVEVDGAVTR